MRTTWPNQRIHYIFYTLNYIHATVELIQFVVLSSSLLIAHGRLKRSCAEKFPQMLQALSQLCFSSCMFLRYIK